MVYKLSCKRYENFKSYMRNSVLVCFKFSSIES